MFKRLNSKKSITLLGFLLFVTFFNLIAAVKVDATIADTSAGLNLFCVTPSDVNDVISNCAVSSMCGAAGNGIRALGGKILGINYTDTQCTITTAKSEGKSDDEIAQLLKEQYQSNPRVLSMIDNANAFVVDQRPASGVSFVSDKIYALTNPGQVYAEDNPESLYNPGGTGSDLLRPVQGFWGWSVNIVFGFLVLLIIIIAFAIMFRQKLGGAAEVTLQNAIPSIAMAMILVPLSYAISGLFIDLVTVGTNATHGFLLGPGSPGREAYNNRVDYTFPGDSSPADDRGLYPDDVRVDWLRVRDRLVVSEEATSLGNALRNNAGVLGDNVFVNTISVILNALFSLPSAVSGQGSLNTSADFAWFGDLINLIISLVSIWIGIKIFIRLFGKWMVFLFYPVISPFIFATAAIPGTGMKNIQTYLKTLLSASLFYIVTYAMFLMAIVFTDGSFQQTIPDFTTGGYVPPLLGLNYLLGGVATSAAGATGPSAISQAIFAIIGLGIYFSIPSTLDNIDKSLGTQFVLPSFIKTPIDSFKEASRITFRAAPAVGARAAMITGARGRDLVSTARNAGFNFARFRDRVNGIDDADSRSAVSQRRQSNIAKRQRLMAELDAAEGDPGKRAQIFGQLKALDFDEGLQGKEFSTKGEEGKDRSINATIQYLNINDQGALRYNFLSTDMAEVRNLLDPAFIAKNSTNPNLYSILSGRIYIRRTIAKVVIEPTNFEFTNPTVVTFAGVTKHEDGVKRYDAKKNPFDRWSSPVGNDENQDIFESSELEFMNGQKVALGNWLFLRAGPPMPPAKAATTQDVVPEGGKKISILIDLYIDAFANNYEDLFKKGTGVFARGVQTPERALRIAPYSSKPFRIQIGTGLR